MNALKLIPTENNVELAWPDNAEHISLASPAAMVFTDFKEHQPLTIDANTKALDAVLFMKKAHVRLKLIVDAHNHFVGVVDLNDLSNEEMTKKVAQGFTRDELTVADFMQHKHELQAMDYQAVAKATIGDIVELLKNSGQQHCLIIDHEIGQIRGLFSASDLARRLHLPIAIDQHSNFINVFKTSRRPVLSSVK